MADDEPKIVKQEILPPEHRDLRVPVGTPLGLAFLGAARFAAIRRVFEQAERAARAKAAFHDAEGAIADSLVRKAAAVEQLYHLDTIRKHTADRIQYAYDQQRREQAAVVRADQAAIEAEEIAKLRRMLDKMEVEEQVRVRREHIAKTRGGNDEAPRAASDEDEFMSWLGKVPDFVKNAEAAKAEIIKNAGGEANISDSLRNTCDVIDSIVQSVLSKQSEKAAL